MSLDKSSRECAAKVMETIPLVVRFVRADMRTHSTECISLPQLRALAFINRNPETCLSDLAEHLGVTCATASITIERLVQRNLVQRTDHPQERRRLALNLTKEGTQLLNQSQEKTRTHIADLLNGLTPGQISQIVESLNLLQDVFGQTEFHS
jgi:DNA-binding MarR family transcriptional regulator